MDESALQNLSNLPDNDSEDSSDDESLYQITASVSGLRTRTDLAELRVKQKRDFPSLASMDKPRAPRVGRVFAPYGSWTRRLDAGDSLHWPLSRTIKEHLGWENHYFADSLQEELTQVKYHAAELPADQTIKKAAIMAVAALLDDTAIIANIHHHLEDGASTGTLHDLRRVAQASHDLVLSLTYATDFISKYVRGALYNTSDVDAFGNERIQIFRYLGNPIQGIEGVCIDAPPGLKITQPTGQSRWRQGSRSSKPGFPKGQGKRRSKERPQPQTE